MRYYVVNKYRGHQARPYRRGVYNYMRAGQANYRYMKDLGRGMRRTERYRRARLLHGYNDYQLGKAFYRRGARLRRGVVYYN